MTKESQPVPCGKCPHCVKRRVSGWSFRLMQEERVSSSAWFVTLTFNNEHVPLSRNGFMSLDKREAQLFFKRLRKLHDTTLKYYLVGEYGGKTYRPHYHAIIFNANTQAIESAWSKDGKPIGTIYFGDVSGASVGYTLKYMSKPQWRPRHRNDDREPQFSTMSKGLGASYLTDNMVRWHNADLNNRMYCNLLDGKKIAMPRYYKDKVFFRIAQGLYADLDPKDDKLLLQEIALQRRKQVGFHQRISMIDRQQDQETKAMLADPNFQWNQVQSDKAAFERMHRHSFQNEKL